MRLSLSEADLPPRWPRLVAVWMIVALAGLGAFDAGPRTVGAAYHPMADGMHLAGPRMSLWSAVFFIALIWALAVTMVGRRLETARLVQGSVAVVALIPLGLIALPFVVGPQPDHIAVRFDGETYAVPRHFGPRPGPQAALRLVLCPGGLDPFYGSACPTGLGSAEALYVRDPEFETRALRGASSPSDLGLSLDGGRVTAVADGAVVARGDWAEGTVLSTAHQGWDHLVFLDAGERIMLWTTCLDGGGPDCEAVTRLDAGAVQMTVPRDLSGDPAALRTRAEAVVDLLDGFRCPGAEGCAASTR